MFRCQGITEIIQIAVHHGVDLIKREVNAVIGNPTLWKVIGPNAVTAITRTN